jgi:hypothetical protein
MSVSDEIATQRTCEHCETVTSWLRPAEEIDPDNGWDGKGALMLDRAHNMLRPFPHDEVVECDCRCHDLYKAVWLGTWRSPL